MTSQPDPLPEIRQRRSTATGLPWRADGDEILDANDLVVAEVSGFTNPEFIAHAPTDIDWYDAEVTDRRREVERLRGLLKELEWAGTSTPNTMPGCPACDELGQHAEGCDLAAAIRSTSGEEQP